jgi:hypothetical protein
MHMGWTELYEAHISLMPRQAFKSTLRWPQSVRHAKIEARNATEIILDVLRSVIAAAAQVSTCRFSCDRLSPDANSTQPTAAKIGNKTLNRWRDAPLTRFQPTYSVESRSFFSL